MCRNKSLFYYYFHSWNIEIKQTEHTQEKNNDKDQDTFVNAYYVKSKLVGKVPSTKLCQTEDGQFLAVGGSDGRITVIDSVTLKEVRILIFPSFCRLSSLLILLYNQVKSLEAHDLPVTGLCFAPNDVANGVGKRNNTLLILFYFTLRI